MKKKTLTVRNFQRNPKTSQQNQNEKKKKLTRSGESIQWTRHLSIRKLIQTDEFHSIKSN
jgi:hypothetical protein